jgi:NAD(P)-dependent dehydrogenase (short-subunit alcohol dehydrogenase family)
VAVTGGASGIGLAIGRRFALGGAAVALLDVDGDAARAQAARLAELGAPASGHSCDVTVEREVEAAVADVIAVHGGVDVLVANAGITQREAFARTDVASLRRVMEVNFFGAVAVVKAALDSLVERRGTVVVTSSIAGLVPLLGRSSYCASKHALHGLFGTVRAELRDAGVHVLVVCPTFVRTNLQARALAGDGSVTTHPQSTAGRVQSPSDVADAVFEATLRRRPLLVMSPVGKISHWLGFLAPSTYERLMARQLATELRRGD